MDNSASNTGAEFQVRPARRGDEEPVQDLIFRVLTEYGLPPDRGATDADLDDLTAFYLEPGGEFLVVETDNGAIIGSAGLLPVNETTVELRKMYLDAAWRGHGLGRMLLERLLDSARAAGYARVSLETAGVLTEAIGLYRRYGFRATGETPVTGRCDQVYALDLDTSVSSGGCRQ